MRKLDNFSVILTEKEFYIMYNQIVNRPIIKEEENQDKYYVTITYEKKNNFLDSRFGNTKKNTP